MAAPPRLSGKIAVLTGGGGGFGEAIAHKFTAEGAKVLVVDVDEARGAQVAAAQPEGSAAFLYADVTTEEGWRRVLEAAVREFGDLNVVINNAGVIYDTKPSTDITEDEYDRIMRINVKPLFLSSKVIIPYFKQRGGGLFINTSSTSSTRARPGQVWYGGTKAAVSNV